MSARRAVFKSCYCVSGVLAKSTPGELECAGNRGPLSRGRRRVFSDTFPPILGRVPAGADNQVAEMSKKGARASERCVEV